MSTIASARSMPTGAALARVALKADAVVTGANGLAYLALAGPLSDLLGVSAPTLRGIGAFLAVFAVGVWIVGSRERLSRSAVGAVAEANAGWVVASLAVALTGALSPTTAGTVWTVMQAVTVGAFAALQLAGRRAL
jgi:hypothetical protein